MAKHCYILGACCFNSAHCDESNPNTRKLVAQCRNNVGMVEYKSNGSLDLAVESCLGAIDLDPTWEKPYYRLGLCYEKQNKIKEAIDAYKHVINLVPSNIEAKTALSRLTSLLTKL